MYDNIIIGDTMKNKGFTLTEILVVIALLSILIIIAVPAIMNVRNSVISKENEHEIEEIKSAASFYAQDEKKSNCCITVQRLITTGYLTNSSGSKSIKIYIDGNKNITYNYASTCNNC